MVDHDLLVPYGWTEPVAARYAALIDPDCVPARVVRMDRSECDVVTPTGPGRGRRPRPGAGRGGQGAAGWGVVWVRLPLWGVDPPPGGGGAPGRGPRTPRSADCAPVSG